MLTMNSNLDPSKNSFQNTFGLMKMLWNIFGPVDVFQHMFYIFGPTYTDRGFKEKVRQNLMNRSEPSHVALEAVPKEDNNPRKHSGLNCRKWFVNRNRRKVNLTPSLSTTCRAAGLKSY